ncbi:DUF2225 domain-containing protein [Alkaliphilus sp. MSJ-5]|uniref:DUF2225 domain-containing protein n=1 Tax=Alkaliphilus flagellatus TaxID=2841507 RepID=A0ABS6FYR1_9FIRM|nr:DUF2225 domain-containing protein [Alkaliphilus flagellatus]MBU5675385.1 DUF2225 domain-containing protein [Alkaliphilus flagellatus]
MEVDNLLYDKDCTCPICKNQFTTKKVRTRSLRIENREDDFNVIYKNINPNYYYIWVCPKCGYSSTEKEFENINKNQATILQQSIGVKWNERSFSGVRTFHEAEESYKMALLVAQILKKSKAYIGGICLRLAWLYREAKSPREEEFLNYTLNFFQNAYQTERLDAAGLDEVSLAYLNGELNRRLGRQREAIKWYSVALDHPDIKTKRHIQLKAREQWRLAREQYGHEKDGAN